MLAAVATASATAAVVFSRYQAGSPGGAGERQAGMAGRPQCELSSDG